MMDHPVTDPHAAAPPSSSSRRRVRLNADGRSGRRRLVTWALFAGCAVLMVNAVIGENGYLATLRASRRTNAVQAEIDKLRLENQQLLERTRRLKTDPTALEEEARKDLGLIRQGETLVILRDATPAPATPPADAAGQGK